MSTTPTDAHDRTDAGSPPLDGTEQTARFPDAWQRLVDALDKRLPASLAQVQRAAANMRQGR